MANIVSIFWVIYSVGFFIVDGIFLAKDGPTLMKKSLNLFAIIFSSSMTDPLYLNLEHVGLHFRLFIIILMSY